MAFEWSLSIASESKVNRQVLNLIADEVENGNFKGSILYRGETISYWVEGFGFGEVNCHAIAEGIRRGQDSGVDQDGGVKIEGRRGTWHQIDQWNGYILWEHDYYGDEAQFVVTDGQLNEWCEGYDSIKEQLSNIFGSRIPPAWSNEAKQTLERRRREEEEFETWYQQTYGKK